MLSSQHMRRGRERESAEPFLLPFRSLRRRRRRFYRRIARNIADGKSPKLRQQKKKNTKGGRKARSVFEENISLAMK